MKYKKISNNENAIEIDGKVVLSFDPRYKEYLKWRDENPDLEKQLIEELEQEIENKRLYNNGAPHVELDENGDRQGKCLFYYEIGIKKWEGQYKDDIVEGELIQYDKLGPVFSKENFIGGELNGEYEYYYDRIPNIDGFIMVKEFDYVVFGWFGDTYISVNKEDYKRFIGEK